MFDATPADPIVCVQITPHSAWQGPQSEAPVSALAIPVWAEKMLGVYDRFMRADPITSADRAAVDRIALAAAFGSAAFMAGMDDDQGTHAMMRSILLALFDPMHPDLDYLRANPEAGAAARAAAEKGGAA